jgi:putative endonuclease
MKTNRQNLGRTGEDLAVNYLQQKGFRILDRNFRIGKAEIDIIALEQEELIIVEVKSVCTIRYGYGEEHISEKKKRMLIRAAYGYLNLFPTLTGKNLRFDVLIVNFDCYPATIKHYRGAFWQKSANLR